MAPGKSDQSKEAAVAQSEAERRRLRQAEALRENLRRRKQRDRALPSDRADNSDRDVT
jgi:hypothetical protein